MELEERREMEAGVLVFHVQARRAFGLQKQVRTPVMLVYDNQEGKKKFILFNRELAEEIHGKISLWLDANMCFHDIVHRIGSEGVDIDEWKS